MKLSIKRFCELQGLEVPIPCEIMGENGTGKSTIKRAFEFVMLMTDSKTGREFTDDVYTEHPRMAADLVADVEIKIGDLTMRRFATPSSAQLNEFGTIENQKFSLQNKFYIDGTPVLAASYGKKVAELTNGNPSSFLCDLNNFFNKKNGEKRQFFVDLFAKNENCEKEYENLKKIILNITELNKDIEKKTAILQENNAEIAKSVQDLQVNCNKMANIEIVKSNIEKYLSEIDKINEAIKANTPTLTSDEREANNAIHAEIEVVKNQVFEKKAPVLVRKSLQNVEILKNQRKEAQNRLRNVLNSEYVADAAISNELEAMKKSAERLRYMVDNYDDLAGAEKCTKCAICTQKCDQMQIDLPKLDDLNADLDEKTAKIKEYEDLLDTQQKMFAEERAAKIENASDEIVYLDRKIAEIEEENAKIEAENSENEQKYAAEMQKYNATLEAEMSAFEREKAAKIKDLEEKLIVPKIVDNSENEEKIKKLRFLIDENKITLQNFEEMQRKHLDLKSVIANRNASNEKISGEINELRDSLFGAKQEELTLQSAISDFYNELQNKVNSALPECFSVELFEKNITTGNYHDAFVLKYNGIKNLSNANEMAMKVEFLRWLQGVAGVNLPIFVDEFANITKKELKEKIKKAGCVILTPAEGKELTIIY